MKISDFLMPLLEHDQVLLKQVYYDACGTCDLDGSDMVFCYGTTFRRVVSALTKTGAIEQSKARNRDGEKVDFFTAVIDMYPIGDERFRVIAGSLTLESENAETTETWERIEAEERADFEWRKYERANNQ